MTTIGIISDTHIRAGGKRQLPPRVFEVFAGVDFILHGGDVMDETVLSDLETIAPTFGVRGNNDGWDLMSRLPQTRRMNVEGMVLGLVHGDLPNGRRAPALNVPGNTQTAGNALSHFLPEFGGEWVDCVIFGHSHRPIIYWHEVAGRKILLFNPGSPTDRRYAPDYGLGILRIDGTRLEPELITW